MSLAWSWPANSVIASDPADGFKAIKLDQQLVVTLVTTLLDTISLSVLTLITISLNVAASADLNHEHSPKLTPKPFAVVLATVVVEVGVNIPRRGMSGPCRNQSSELVSTSQTSFQ
jgi:hypothetical protein